MGRKSNSKFPAAKIKKIIQENQEIGKLCNSIPPIIQRSLEMFLDDIVEKLNTIISEYELNKLTLPALKRAVEDSDYEFMKEVLQDVEDLEKTKKRPRKNEPHVSGNKKQKKSDSDQ